jgi:hypothetical protein
MGGWIWVYLRDLRFPLGWVGGNSEFLIPNSSFFILHS